MHRRLRSLHLLLRCSYRPDETMIVRNLWLSIVLLAIVLLVITETSARNQLNIKEDEHNALKSSDVKTKQIRYKAREFASENSAEDLQGKKKFVKVQSESNNFQDRERRSVVNGINERINVHERNGEDGGRFRRNVTEFYDLKNAKKSYTKVKLAQTQSGFKNWKNKDSGKYVDEQSTKKRLKRRLNYRSNTGRSKRYTGIRKQRDDKSDYYTLRNAVMERFYARQKEIAKKYAAKTSTTPKYIHTYDVDKNTDTNNVSSSRKIEKSIYQTNSVTNALLNDLNTTSPKPVTISMTKIARDSHPKQVRPVENSSEVNVSDDYDYILDDNKPRSSVSSNGVLTDKPWIADDRKNTTLKWGNCAGNLIYQHNLILNVHNSSFVEANVTTSMEGPFCVSCIRALPLNMTQATVSVEVNRDKDGTFKFVHLSMRAFHQEVLSYIIKIWATGKMGDHCDNVKP